MVASRHRWLCVAVLALGVASAPAFAQVKCPDGSTLTQASCGGDTCECAPSCTGPEQCQSNCCFQGYCSLACACTTSGATLDLKCGENPFGCGASVAAAKAPFGGMGFAWGLGLMAVGAVATLRFRRRGGGARLAAALLVVGLGAGLVAATLTQRAEISASKALVRR